MNPKLSEMLVCPVCKVRLRWNAEKKELVCLACALGFAVKDGIPNMIAHDARSVPPEEIEAARALEKRQAAAARRQSTAKEP